jgi:hypothetical protein
MMPVSCIDDEAGIRFAATCHFSPIRSCNAPEMRFGYSDH